MQSFNPLTETIVDVNTGQKITAKFDTGTGLASPESWGMVRWHPHAPVLQLPPRKTYLLAGIPQDAVLGTLRDSDLSKGLETLVDALSARLARLELPPGQRGNPLPVHEVITQEFKRLYPDDDGEETNTYRKQVYTWRHSDIVRAAGRLHLSIGDLFSAGAARPQDFINFAGDTYYVDPRRLEEPNCEPRMEDAMLLDNGKTLVFRPKHGPRDRPATWHNNYSEVTGGRPDPLHDFGIKSIKSDAPWGGYVTGHRYACCWQAMGSPGCLIGYPSYRKPGEVRNEQGCLEKASGFPVLYQWFGGFPPSDQTVNFRGIAFKDREYADALHEKIVKALSESDTIERIAKGERLTERQARVVLQVAEWMHQYNVPLMGCALYPKDLPETPEEVEAYLDRVVTGRPPRSGTGTPKQEPPPKAPLKETTVIPPPAPKTQATASKTLVSWWDLVINPSVPIPNNDDVRLKRLRMYYFKFFSVLSADNKESLRVATEQYQGGKPALLDGVLFEFSKAASQTREIRERMGTLLDVYSPQLDDIDNQYLINGEVAAKVALGKFKEQLLRDVPLLQAVRADAQFVVDYHKEKRDIPDDIWQLLIDVYRGEYPPKIVIDAEGKNDWETVRGRLNELPRFLETLRMTWNAYHSNRSASAEDVYDAFTDVMRFSSIGEEKDMARIWTPTEQWKSIPATNLEQFNVFIKKFVQYMKKEEEGRTDEEWQDVMKEVERMTKAAPPGPSKGFPKLPEMEARIAKKEEGVIPVFADMVNAATFKGKPEFNDLAEYLGFMFDGKYARKIAFVSVPWSTVEPFIQLQRLRVNTKQPFVFVAEKRGTAIAFVILDCLATFLKTRVDHRQWCRNAINVLGSDLLYSVLRESNYTNKLRRLLNAGLYGVESDRVSFDAGEAYPLRDDVESFYKLASALFLRREKDWQRDDYDRVTIYPDQVAFDKTLPIQSTVRATLANRDFYVSHSNYNNSRSWVFPSVDYFNRVIERVLEGIAEIQWTGNLDVDAFLERF
jgi:hypothetical protein